MAALQKLCTVCGEDVASKKRVKDPRGNYYCQPCFDEKAKAVRGEEVAARSAQSHVGSGAIATAGAAVAEPPADDGMLDLAPVRDEPRKEMAKAACATCKKLVPEKSVRNLDGEFICNACFTARNQRPAGKAGKPGKPAAVTREEETAGNSELKFNETLTGGGLISAGVLAAGFFIFFGLYTFLPEKGDAASTAMNLGLAVFQTVFVAVRAGVLLLSMIVAARILGGISFGYLGPAVYKSLSFFVGLTVADFFMDRSESFAMIGFGLRFIAFAAAFMALFKIDMFEAFLLSVVNTAMSWVLGFIMLLLLAGLFVSATAGHRAPSGKEMDVDPDDEEWVVPGEEAPKGAAPGAREKAPDAPAAVQVQ